jgi:cyanophycinase
MALAIMSCREPAARGQSLDEVLGLPESFDTGRQGSLILDGGKLAEPSPERFLELAGGREARILVITAASRLEPETAAERYSWWTALPGQQRAASVLIWSPAWENEPRNEEALAFLETATGVWITGGDQSRLEDWLVEGDYGNRIREVFRRGGVIGGTSAGTAILSRPAILGGNAEGCRLGNGLGLLTKAVTEQHLDRPGRLQRIVSVVEQSEESRIGIGVQEHTALIIRGNSLETAGAGSAVFVFPSSQGGCVTETLEAGQSATIERHEALGFRLRKSPEGEPGLASAAGK